MEKEIKERIEELKLAAQEPYVDSKVREIAQGRLEKLEDFYDVMYGY